MDSKKVIAIPYVSDRGIELMAQKIRPIVSVNGKKHFLGGYTVEEMKKTTYSFTRNYGKHLEEPAENIELVTQIKTLHKFGAPNFFKPSIAEVFSQIPTELKDCIDGFEVTLEDYPSDKEFVNEAFKKGYHVATTKLYKKTIN